jgi:hypothetical protein
VASTARWALLPLVEEAYTIFVASTFILATLLELAACSGPPPAISTSGLLMLVEPAPPAPADDEEQVNWRTHLTALLSFREQVRGCLHCVVCT